jgi:hypothetical protein
VIVKCIFNKKIFYFNFSCLFFLVAIKFVQANSNPVALTVTVPALVQISGLSDISLSPTSFATNVTGNTTACIYTNVIAPLGSYYVTATSTYPLSGGFQIFSSALNKYISYSAFWNNTSAASQTVALTSGTKTAQQSGGNSTALNCSNVANANFNIRLSAAQVAGAVAGTYTDTVTLVISPT